MGNFIDESGNCFPRKRVLFMLFCFASTHALASLLASWFGMVNRSVGPEIVAKLDDQAELFNSNAQLNSDASAVFPSFAEPETLLINSDEGQLDGAKQPDGFLDTIAFIVVSRGLTSAHFQAQLRTWLAEVSNLVVFDTNNDLTGSHFLEALDLLTRRFHVAPIEWFVLIDDDGYMNISNLEALLRASVTSVPVYAGLHHCQGVDFKCKQGKVKQTLGGWVNGGAGIILNAHAAASVEWKASAKYYESHWPYTCCC